MLTFDTTAAPVQALIGRLPTLEVPVYTNVLFDPMAPGQFRFRMYPPSADLLDPSSLPSDGGDLATGVSYLSPLRVAWLGVDPTGGCPPGATEVLGRSVRCCEPQSPRLVGPLPFRRNP
jgi:hypothetical protein